MIVVSKGMSADFRLIIDKCHGLKHALVTAVTHR